MKKLILAFIILVVSVTGGYSLYKFTSIFDKHEDIVEVESADENVESTEIIIEK